MNDTGGKQQRQPSKAPITYQGFLVDTTTLSSSAFLIQCEIPKKMPEQSHAWIGNALHQYDFILKWQKTRSFLAKKNHMHSLAKKLVVLYGPDHVQVFWKHKSIGNISQLETRPLISWLARWSTNLRPGFQLTYVSKTLILPKHLHMIRPYM